MKGFEVVNLGNDSPNTINTMIHHIEAFVGRKAQVDRRPVHKADVPATWADITKARSYGWAPTVSLEEGLRRTVAWYRENTAWVKDVDTGED